LLANTEASQRILVMKQKTAAEHFRRALKRIADFGWIRITSPEPSWRSSRGTSPTGVPGCFFSFGLACATAKPLRCDGMTSI
jgi:hypothetical protein